MASGHVYTTDGHQVGNYVKIKGYIDYTRTDYTSYSRISIDWLGEAWTALDSGVTDTYSVWGLPATLTASINGVNICSGTTASDRSVSISNSATGWIKVTGGGSTQYKDITRTTSDQSIPVKVTYVMSGHTYTGTVNVTVPKLAYTNATVADNSTASPQNVATGTLKWKGTNGTSNAITGYTVTKGSTQIYSGTATSCAVDLDYGTNIFTVTATAQYNSPSVNIRIVRYPVLKIQYNLNGGTIADAPHQYGTNSRWFKYSNSLVTTSITTADGSYSTLISSMTTADSYIDLWNVATYNATKTGYHITGTKAYNTKADGTGVDINQDSTASSTNIANTTNLNGGTTLTANKTISIYVNWQPNSYTIKYNATGAIGSTNSSTHYYGTSKKLTTNGFTKPGYIFYGWATTQAKADAGTRDYTNGQSVLNLTSSNGGTINLYAVWQAAPPTNKYELPIAANTNSEWLKSYSYWANINKTWKKIQDIWVNVDGIWRKVF